MDPADMQWKAKETIPGQIIDYFCFARTEGDGKVLMTIDAFLPLAGALVGLSPREASSLFFKSNQIGPPPAANGETPLTLAIGAYVRLAGWNPTKIIGTSTFSNQRDRAFSQRLKDHSQYRIDIWLPAAGTFAAVALALSHLAPVIASESHLTAELQDRVDQYNRLLTMLAVASADRGTLVIKDLVIASALPRQVVDGLQMFNAAMTFSVFHELAHVELGHIDSSPRDPAEMRERELAADTLAFSRMSMLNWRNPWNPLFGTAITFLARSLVSRGPDDALTPTHPSLVSRMRALTEANDPLISRPPGASLACLDPFLRMTLANLHDRDRCPAWFGQTRREVLGLPPDHVFNFKRLDFASQGRIEADDATRRPSAARNLMSLLKKKRPPKLPESDP